ncbi:hypothetical protein BH23BAC3_BH23BAC3_22450 [soil metagenome]
METIKGIHGFRDSYSNERKDLAHTTRISESNNTTVTLRQSDSENLISLNYQGRNLGHVDISDVTRVNFIPLPAKTGYSLVELEKISSGMKKARQMRQQQINMIESFLG